MSHCKSLRTLVLSAFSVFALTAMAGDDFGIWTDLSFEKKITRQLSVDAGVDFRSEQNLKSVSRWAGSIGLAYKPAKFFKASAGYAYIYDRSPQETKESYGNKSGRFNGYNVDHGFWRSKHRFYVDVTGRVSFSRFTLSLRERYQYTRSLATTCTRDRYRDPKQQGYTGEIYVCNGQEFMTFERVSDDKKAKDANYLRSRLELEYDIRHCPVDPFISFELSNDLSDGLHLDKKRYSVGADWKLSKKHRLSFAYLYQNGADDDGSDNIHVINVGYKFSF